MGPVSDDFTAYVAARWRTLVHSAMLLGCSLAEAEDLTQTTLATAYAKWGRVLRMEHRDAYVATMLLNTLRASRRRRWWQQRPTAVLPDRAAPDPTDALAEQDVVVRALGRLTTQHREVVVLRHYVLLSESETAEALGIPRGTVKSRLSRALTLLAADDDLRDAHHGRLT